MTPEEFRAAGHELIDWIADQRASIPDKPVRAGVVPGEVRGGFESDAPTETVGISEMLDELDRVVVPGLMQVQHPMHFGWFPSNAGLSSVLGDIASSGLGNLGISWESSPALTEVEEVVCEWLRQLTGLTEAWSGTIHDTASTACLTSLLVAREQATSLSQNSGGLQAAPEPLVVYTTAQAHSSVAKAALLAGYGWDNIRSVATDPWTRAMLPEALAEAIRSDVAAGSRPAAVIATVGTTGTTAIDPVADVAVVLQAATDEGVLNHKVWLHVDAAMAGSAMLLPEMRHLFEGVEQADAISWNPHKWMGTILDCSLLYIRDIELLERVMSTNPSYLWSPDDDEVTQFRDRGIPLGRRFRSLKLLFQLRLDGIEAIQARLRRDIENARWLAEQVGVEPGWEVVAPVDLQTVCVRHTPGSDLATSDTAGSDLADHTLGWVRALNATGKAFLTPAKLGDGWIARVSVGVEATERSHVAEVWELMKASAAAEARQSSTR